MNSIFQEVLIVLGVVVLAFALRSFHHPVVRKTGALCVLFASYLAAYFIFDNHFAGIGAMLAWFFLPWIELLTRIRRLRLPVDKELRHKMPPTREQFPNLTEMTDEIEEAGFEYVDDVGWEWDGMEQFFRIFYHSELKTQATICLNRQQGIAFSYVAITSRDKSGTSWRTWDYPFSYTMKMAPGLRLNRDLRESTFEGMMDSHREFLESHGLDEEADLVEENPEDINNLMEREVRGQVDHNLSRGLITLSDKGTFRYSWRGLLFLWTQFVKDMVKLS